MSKSFEFTPWQGGHPKHTQCPVPNDHNVSVKFRDNSTDRNNEPQYWDWSNRGYDDDIVGYFDHTAECQQ